MITCANTPSPSGNEDNKKRSAQQTKLNFGSEADESNSQSPQGQIGCWSTNKYIHLLRKKVTNETNLFLLNAPR